jgi:putative membrane protein
MISPEKHFVDMQQPDIPKRSDKGPEDPRVRFAAERTLLAWIRTGLALMGFGFVVARFGLFLRELAVTRTATPTHSYGMSLWIGTALVVLGIVVTVAAAAQYRQIIGRLSRTEDYVPPRWPLGLIFSGALAILGVAIVAYLLFVSP